MIILLLPFVISMHRIIPLHSTTSAIILSHWMDALPDNSNKKVSLSRMIQFASESKGDDAKGIIAIINDDHNVTAIANLINSPITLVDIETSDFSSGTLLMKALLKTDSNVKLSSSIDDRWKIASLYFLPK